MKEKSKDKKSQPTCSVEEYEKLANLHAALTEFMGTPADISDVDYNFKRQKLIYEMDKLWPNFERICKNLGISLEYNSSVKLRERAEANFARSFCGKPPDTSECDATSKVTLDRTKSVISDWSKSGKPIIYIFGQSNAEYMQKLKQVFDDVLVRLQDVFGKKPAGTGQLHKTPSVTAGDTSNISFTRESTLDSSTYNKILKICHDTGVAIERLPNQYEEKDEETLRDHFLTALSSYFSSATGETFNKRGKTDILIRHDGKNVFIAECKFWKGIKSYYKTIDQLLSYLNWRDSKAAILCFIKNKKLTQVLGHVEKETSGHSCFVKNCGKETDSQFHFSFHLKGDKALKVELAVLCFHFPNSDCPPRKAGK